MAVANLPAPRDRRAGAVVRKLGTEVRAAAVVLGRATETNSMLAAAFSRLGYDGVVAHPASPPTLVAGDLALARIDVLPELEGIEEGLWQLPLLERQGARVLNGPVALLAAHDKLLTALLLGRAGVAQPRTAHVRDLSVPAFP